MLKGILLSIFLSIFGASSVVCLFSLSGKLQENIITGNVIGISRITNYSVVAVLVSLIIIFFIILWMKRN